MEKLRFASVAALALSGVLLVGCGDDENEQGGNAQGTAGSETSTPQQDDASSSESSYGGVGTDPSVSTGQAGTTSGITGSDMNEEDETTGTGQSRADQMVKPNQSETVSQSADTAQPEEEAPSSGSSTGGGDNEGMPQASNPNYSGEESRQSEGQQ